MPFKVSGKYPEIFSPKDNSLFKSEIIFFSNHLNLMVLFNQSYFSRSNESLLQCFLKTHRYAVL